MLLSRFLKNWVGRFQVSLTRWTRSPTETPFTRVPPEIILIILEHLPPESVISFSLTCRTFYRAYMDPFLPMGLASQQTLLLWIERDIGGLYFCHQCHKLHTWKRERYGYGVPIYNGACRLRSQSGEVGWCGHPFLVEYHTARLIMNRHLYGASHGPPLRHLQVRHARRDRYLDVKIEQSLEARIIDDELFLHIRFTVHQDRGRWTDSNDILWDAICPHLTISEVERYKSLVPDLIQRAVVPDRSGRVAGPVRSCPQCFTDYQIDVDWLSFARAQRQKWVIRVQKWAELGNCRSPQDDMWCGLTRGDKLGEERSLTCPAGTVRQRWVELDGDSGDEVASFVGK